MAALFGTDTLINPTFGVVFVLLWVGLVPAALLFGPIYRACNPLRWIHRGICRVMRVDYREGVFSYPKRLGLWPASLTLVRLRLAGAGQPDLHHRPDRDRALVRGGRDSAAARRHTVRQRVVRERRSVRGVLDAGVAAVAVRAAYRRRARASATRWRISTALPRCPGWRPSCRCSLARLPSTPSRSRRAGWRLPNSTASTRRCSTRRHCSASAWRCS